MASQFDTQALRQWQDEPFPAADDPKRFALWNQLRSDLAAAADEIERLEAVVAEVAA